MTETSRRQMMTAAMAGGLALAAGGAEAARPPIAPKTYVLVHGTWLGGWIWRDVADRLIGFGHKVFTPTCTGCGERVHLATPEVGLDTHIQDIANVIEWEELDDVILVGHSFAGITITGVADRMRDRIRRIVFFDALVPDLQGGRMSGVARNADGSLPEYWLKRQEKFVDGQMLFWEEYPMEMLIRPQAYPEIAEKLRRRVTPHPARQWSDELAVENGGWEGLPRSYVHAIDQEYSMSSERMVGRAREDGWQFIELPTGRMGMMTHPDLVAGVFLGLD